MTIKHLASLAALPLTAFALAQTYTPAELSGGYMANSVSAPVIGGQTLSRAALWTMDGVLMDVHPDFLATNLGPGRSTIQAVSGNLAVGNGQRQTQPNQSIAIRWDGTNPSALADPFPVYTSVALATDGIHIVGWAAAPNDRRGVIGPGTSHAIIWNAATGQVEADLSGGKATFATGVFGNQQVGYEDKSSFFEARLWNGTAQNYVNLHPRNFDTSVANATDGVHQVGTVGASVKVFDESRRGARVLMQSAAVWSGTAESMITLGFFTPGYSFYNSLATSVNGNYVCGVGVGKNRSGVTQINHAVVWSLSDNSFIDLHGSLPAAYKSSSARGVDSQGNVVGYGVDSSNVVHAIVWRKS